MSKLLLIVIIGALCFPVFANEADWALLNEWVEAKVGTPPHFSFSWFFLIFDLEPAIMLDGRAFTASKAIISTTQSYNTKTITYHAIIAPYDWSPFGVIDWGPFQAEDFRNSMFYKKMGVDDNYINEIIRLRNAKDWFPFLGGVSMITGAVFIWVKYAYPRGSNVTVSGDLDPLAVGLAAIGIGVLCDIITGIINAELGNRYTRIVENLNRGIGD
jgi:hypothetical protein